MNKNKEELNERDIPCLWIIKIQHCQDINSSQLDRQTQINTNQNPSKLFHGYWHTDFCGKVKDPGEPT